MGRAYPISRALNPHKAAALAAVSFDAVGAGGTFSSAVTSGSATWSHTATGPVVVFGQIATQGTTVPTRSCTYGGTAMTLLGSLNYVLGNPSCWTDVYGLLSPAAGAQTVSYAFTGATGDGVITLTADSVSYKNVTSFGTPVTSTGTTTTPSVTVSSATGHMAAATIASATTASSMTGFNQTSRYSMSGATFIATIIGDAAGAASKTFSATATSGAWGCIALDLV